MPRSGFTMQTFTANRCRPSLGSNGGRGGPLTRKRHIPPHSAQPQHTNDWAPRTRKRHQQEHRPQRPTERSDPTQHAKGRTGDCPGPRKEAATRRNVTQGGVAEAKDKFVHLSSASHFGPLLQVSFLMLGGGGLGRTQRWPPVRIQNPPPPSRPPKVFEPVFLQFEILGGNCWRQRRRNFFWASSGDFFLPNVSTLKILTFLWRIEKWGKSIKKLDPGPDVRVRP